MALSLLASLWRTDATGRPISVPTSVEAAPADPAPKTRAAIASTRTGLRKALSEAIEPTHERISHHAFFKSLKDKSVTRAQVAGYLIDQDHVLAALETSLLMRVDEPALRPMIDLRVINREGLAAQDAAALGLAEVPAPSPAARRLAAHIGAIGRGSAPALLAIHAYVQYNAMLNGGQDIAYGIRKLFREDMTVFRFDPPAKKLAPDYVNAINKIECGSTSVEELCAEAQLAFNGNVAMLDDIMARRQGVVAHLFDDIPMGS